MTLQKRQPSQILNWEHEVSEEMPLSILPAEYWVPNILQAHVIQPTSHTCSTSNETSVEFCF